MTAFPITTALGLDPDDVVRVVEALAERDWTLATAESLTGGLVAALLTEVPGSSAVIRGGLVVYATDLKHRLAGVNAALLDRVGPVDPDVADALAVGAARVCGATLGLGLTGVAGPAQQHGLPVGTCFLTLAGPAGLTRAALDPADFRGADRQQVRAAVVRAGLGLLQQMVDDGGVNPGG